MMKSNSYAKVKNACSIAAKDKFEYIWIDTCCIDKASSAELSEALNSMYRWYQEAEECYAYLADVPENTVDGSTGVTGPEFRKSRWFTRGWTLQELIAPSTVTFLDSKWHKVGTKSNLQHAISEITGIPDVFLLGDDLEYASVAQRMSWASKRETKRIEDLAYCLMGLFGIYMPMLYGEGERAFIRLQEEIIKVTDDHSIFAWKSKENHGGILATSPAMFSDSGNYIPINGSLAISSPSTITSRGVCLSVPFIDGDQPGTGLAILHCTKIGEDNMRLAVHLRDVFLTKQDFVREQSSALQLIDVEHINPLKHHPPNLYIRQWRPTRNRKWEDIEKCVIKLERVKRQEMALRIANLDSDCELSDGLMIINTVGVSDGILGRLLVVCKDGKFFQILLKKYGRSLSADISTSTNLQDVAAPAREQNDQDRIVRDLGDGCNVHVVIKKRVILLREGRSLTGVVEISYSSSIQKPWLEHVTMLEKAIKAESLISYAALRGLKAVVEHLLYRESIESDSKDRDGRTPLSWAAAGGQEAIVRFLLENGAELESKDKDDRTPLSWAAEAGQEAIIWLMLAKAAMLEGNKNNTVVRGLLSQNTRKWVLRTRGAGTKLEFKLDCNKAESSWIDSKDSRGRTPLLYAASKGHDAAVQLLLDTGRVDVNLVDKNGWTPLSLAAARGHKAVVKLMLDTGRVDVNLGDKNGWTPLSLAAARGHEAVVKLMLDTGRVNVNLGDKDGWTPLSLAATRGHEAVVKLMLDTCSSILS